MESKIISFYNFRIERVASDEAWLDAFQWYFEEKQCVSSVYCPLSYQSKYENLPLS